MLSKIKSAVSKVKTAVTNAWNTVKSAAQTIITANRTTITPRKSGESVSQWKARQAQEKAKKSSAKADLASVPLNLYEGTKGWLSRKLQNCVEQIDSSIFGSAVYAAADFVCQAQKAACKGFAYCFNYAQEKIPDKDLSRILTGVGMIVGGAGKVTGAVALAALSAPLCAAGIGVAGEIAAGIVAASGGGDIAQGIQEIMYGWNGDSESESFNLVRDTLYCGNEEAYQISTGIAAASADLGKLLEVGLTKIAAKKAAKSAAKEAAEAVAKDAAEAAAKEAVESAAKGAGGLIDEAVEATAKEAAESAIKESVKQGTRDAIEDVAENSVDDLLNSTEDFYDDIFDPYYKEQFNPIGEEAIGNPNGIEGISKGGSSSGKYQVGAYQDIKGVEGLDAHHVGQKALMKKLVADYDELTAPAINVPKLGHTKRHPERGIVSRSTKGITNARQLLARDLFELKRVYPDIPNSALKELIDMNKKMYPEMRK